MSWIHWIPFPRAGTTVMPGRWLCTVQSGHNRRVEPLRLMDSAHSSHGDWRRQDGSKVGPRRRVIAIAHMPEAYKP